MLRGFGCHIMMSKVRRRRLRECWLGSQLPRKVVVVQGLEGTPETSMVSAQYRTSYEAKQAGLASTFSSSYESLLPVTETHLSPWESQQGLEVPIATQHENFVSGQVSQILISSYEAKGGLQLIVPTTYFAGLGLTPSVTTNYEGRGAPFNAVPAHDWGSIQVSIPNLFEVVNI